MRGKLTLLAGVCAGAIAFPAFAQDTAAAEEPVATTDIVVTAQRSSQRLQDVPIAVSAFSSEALDKQQIKNTSDLQLSLPNVTFTKGNFTGSSFTIRGIGDLCVGVTCDSATAIHMNNAPLAGTRLFESEFYDMGQIEVLRGPQGTLYGRNATSGVINFKTQTPKLTSTEASVEAEYGNYNSIKGKMMVNLPLGDVAAVRVAGFYLNRGGYTTNIFDNTKLDDRDMWGGRVSLRVEPDTGTTMDFMVQYFHEKDNRMRIQKQMCDRDPTGVLGCLAGSREFEMTNANTSFVGVLTSKQFFAINGLPTSFALGDLYGVGATNWTSSSSLANYGNTIDPYNWAGATNPADYRTVNTDFTPTYYTREWIAQAGLDQDLGGGLNLSLQGNYQNVVIESQQDYNLSVQNRANYAPALNTLAFFAAGNAGAVFVPYFAPLAAALIPNGPNGTLCTSLPEETGTGVFGGHRLCSTTPQDFDRSNSYTSNWSAEAIISSKWDGKFNILLGGIYSKFHLTENSYYVDAFGIDYFVGVFGSFTSLSTGRPPSYLGTPTFRNNSDDLRVNSQGLFGEAYYDFNDSVKLTLGVRYNHDEKFITARSTLASFITPYTATNAYQSPYAAGFDADPATACSPSGSNVAGAIGSVPGCEAYQIRSVSFSEMTGRAVLNFDLSPDNMVYLSYSRGYKSGGINPPLQPIFTVPETFDPEFVNAFEVGSKNTLMNGKMTFNVTAFYYNYKDLQLSRIVARTSVNDNVSATIYGLEIESVIRPTPELSMNFGASYLHTEVSEDKLLANPRDFGGGRADAVIIKDITNGANCAVAPTTAGNASGTQQFVTLVNGGLGLLGPAGFGAGSGIASTGAFGICNVLAGAIAAPSAGLRGIFATPTGPLPFTVYSAGIASNIKGNKLPGAPDYKFSAGIQYAAPVGEMTLTPRVDFVYTGKSTGNIFNGAINEVPSFSQVNAQLQLDGPNRKWFLRGWIQNLTDNDAITGLYVTDQSSGNYTNVFTLEPRRYGITAGMKF
ncbi:TonB-dependent receptor [Novosphingobium sp.]|uniref:TonB-dependent receptor n=1 Tax=Novosphingobium sp. TaxID=1874826 RepID=UPI00286BCD10|nr:TonB-dependent receptor [Novosphingobium sp.]